MRFSDRREAGAALGARLRPLGARSDIVVIGLPRGGIPVAAAVAEALGAPLDVLPVRKLGLPGHEEYAMGAIAPGGVRVLDDSTLARFGVAPEAVARVVEDEGYELARRERLYRGGRAASALDGRTVILVDDGLATGATMRAAVRSVRAARPARVIVAIPVAPAEAIADLAREADEVVCLETPDPFFAVGAWYDDFRQVSDDEVRAALDAARPTPAPVAAPVDAPSGAE